MASTMGVGAAVTFGLKLWETLGVNTHLVPVTLEK
jgi:hypothetical protein